MSYKKGKLFYAEFKEGYKFRITIETLYPMARAKFKISKDGIFSKVGNKVDPRPTILFDVKLLNDKDHKTYKYHVKKDMYIDLNLKHLKEILRNIKKRDKLVIYIEKDDPKRFKVLVETSESKKQISSITLQPVKKFDYDDSVNLPEDELDEGDCYPPPMILDSTDFSKVKTLAKVNNNKIHIKMQDNNFMSFYGNAESVIDTTYEFGEVRYPDNESSNCSSDESEEDNFKHFEKDYDVDLINKIGKLTSISEKMEFFQPPLRPGFEEYYLPLKIKVEFASGSITVYIKDKDAIAYEKQHNENDM